MNYTMDKVMKRIEMIIFAVLPCIVILSFTGLYFVLDERQSSDSQELTAFSAPTLSGYLSGSFQEQFEQALKDQFALHDQAIGLTAAVKAKLGTAYNSVHNLLRAIPSTDGLMPYGNVFRMYSTDWLTNMPYTYQSETVHNTLRKADEINAFSKRHASARFYVYYCTRAEDLDWFDQTEGVTSYPYAQLLQNRLDANIRFDQLKFRDFAEYSQMIYKTDHHWNHRGAAGGYADILRMMSQDYSLGSARSILHTEDFNNLLWNGSRSRESGVDIPLSGLDLFCVNHYLLGEHKTWFGDDERTIGLQADYAKGEVNRELEFDQYLNYYGFESKVIRLEFDASEHNLLIIGDSFARAIREPLASHFGTTVYVNFRILSSVDLDELMEQYSIDTVLLIGQQDAWSGYFLSGGEAE